MQQIFDLKITKLTTLQHTEEQPKKRKSFPQNRFTLWKSFNEIFTPSGCQFQFNPFNIIQSSNIPSPKKIKDQKIIEIQRRISVKQKILEDNFMPKKISKIITQVELKQIPDLSNQQQLFIRKIESYCQTARTQSATPIMRKSRPHSRPIDIKDNKGLFIGKCSLHDRQPKIQIKLDYTNVQNTKRSRTINSCHTVFKKSITIAKWEHSEKSDDIF